MGERIYIKKCPFCGNRRFKDYCIDWQDNQYIRCLDCDLVFQSSYERYDYSKNYWSNVIDPDGTKRDLTKERDFKIKNWYGGIIDYINGLPNGRILDVGCGLGYLLSAIDTDWEKIGYDVTNDSFSFIKKQIPNITLISGEIEELFKQYDENTFDMIVCYHVIEHLDRPVQFFNKISQLLTNNGTLITGTPNISSFCAIWFKGNYRLLGNGHICLFKPQHIKELYKNNGLDLVKIEYPFFKTSYFTLKNIIKLIDKRKISPPFYGNIMTFYGSKLNSRRNYGTR